MPTDFIVMIKTTEPGALLGKAGDETGPIVDAITKALSQIGATLKSATLIFPPASFPPIYAVSVSTSEVGTEDFQGALYRNWPAGQDLNGGRIPGAKIMMTASG